MKTLNPSEISELIKSRIDKVNLASEARNEGTVTSVYRWYCARARLGRCDARRDDRISE